MIEDIGRDRVTIMSRFETSITHKKKEAWANIAANVNACRVANRMVEDKKKWKVLKSAAINSVRGQTKTGVGPPVKPPPFANHCCSYMVG